MRQIVQTFEVEAVQEDHMKDQYFIMYTTNEGEDFNPEQLFGVWGLSQVAHIMNRFRQTGVLLKPIHMPWRHQHKYEYEAINDATAVYVLCPSDILYKKFTYVEMSRSEAEAYTDMQREARRNVEQYIKDPQ